MLHKQRYLSPGYKPGFQKTYLSRELTRAMSIDMPIGDPHGGPAYGERNDPISAIVSIATLVGTGGAVIAGTASLMTGLAFAGAALSLVGNITGNGFLSKLGMVTGLVGGIGGLAESAGLFSSGTLGQTFGYGEAAKAASGGLKLAQAAGSQAPVVDGVQQAANVADDILANPLGVQGTAPGGLRVNPNLTGGPASELIAPTSVNPMTLSAGGGGGGLAISPLSNAASPVSAPSVGLANAPTAPLAAPASMAGSGMGVSIPNVDAVMPVSGLSQSAVAGNPLSNMMSGVKDLGSSAMDFLKTNPNAAYVIGSAAGSVGDYLSGKTEAQINQMEASGELSKAQADRIRYEIKLNEDRRRQLNQNYATVANPLATYDPNFQVAPMPGLIANSMNPPRP